jgi:hypothetical protein
MCQGSCSTNSCQQTCSSAESQLRTALAEIQTLAQQQLQAMTALPHKEGQPAPGAFAMQLIVTRAEAALAAAPATENVKPITVHRGSSTLSAMLAGCGCRSDADCTCRVMDQAASLLYRSHERHRNAA